MSVRYISDDNRVVVRDHNTAVGLATSTLLTEFTPDEARRLARALCVAAERVDDRDTEAGLDAA